MTFLFRPVAVGMLLFVGLAWANETSSANKVRFQFKDEPWEKVLDWVAQLNDATVMIDVPPSGKFTYSDTKEYTPTEALDLVHGALLDRGITLVRTGGLIKTTMLGDDMPWELVPFVPAEQLDRTAPHEVVMTTLPLHSLTGDKVAVEVEMSLTPRGRMIGNKIANRVIVFDRAGVCLQVRDLLALIDPPTESTAARLRIYRLQHARAKEVEPIVRELLGLQGQKPGGLPEGLAAMLPPDMNPENFTNVLFDRQFLSSFTPGYKLKGVGTEKAKEKMKTTLTMDAVSNSIFVVAEADTLSKVDEVVAAVDRPGETGGPAAIQIRSFLIKAGNADKVALQLESVLADSKTLSVKGIDRVLVVRGTARDLVEVENLMATITQTDEEIAGFRLSQRRAIDLVPQIERLFQVEGETPPRVVPDSVENTLLVRGSRQQVDQVRQMLVDLGEMTPGSAAAPSLKVGRAGGSSPRNQIRPSGRSEKRGGSTNEFRSGGRTGTAR
jgi:type II secretory pathway component GspD/PulD (secretin)